MNRWSYRIVLILMLLIFGLVFLQLYKQLVMLQQSQGGGQPASSSTSR
jgi:hypothetical protein